MITKEAMEQLKQHNYWAQFRWEDEVCEAVEYLNSLIESGFDSATNGERIRLAISALESIGRIMTERDTLLNDLKIARDCHSCLYNKRENLNGVCGKCFLDESYWEWRGVQK